MIDIYSIKIGDVITTDVGIKLADEFGLTFLADRVEKNPENYKDFVFDGCSCLPDRLMGLFTGCKWQDITYLCCMPHDIQYAYGEIGNSDERKAADYLFENNLINSAKMSPGLAAIFLWAVEIGGPEEFGLSFSWGFANNV